MCITLLSYARLTIQYDKSYAVNPSLEIMVFCWRKFTIIWFRTQFKVAPYCSGATQNNPAAVNKVLRVSVSVPVEMTEFWSTESMGVAIQPCLCEAEKLSQVEREEGKMIEESCTKSGNRWVIPYPWKRNPSLLPDN